MVYFKNFYNDIKDMTDYVYHSSEGREYQMKNKNQEGQMGLLKTELMKMTTVLKEKVALLHSEKIFLNDTISDISHQLKTPMTSLMLLTDLMYNDLDKEKKKLKGKKDILLVIKEDKDNFFNAEFITYSYVDTLKYQAIKASLNSAKEIIAINNSNIDKD